MPTLATKENCTGCTACASACPKGCIAMVADDEGFLQPMIDAEMCVDCGLCKTVCPVVCAPQKRKSEPLAYAAYSSEDAIRMESSSGGIFTELAKVVLKDHGVVCGAAYNAHFEVVHILVEAEADLAKLRGAKYAQSDLRGVFPKVKQQLDEGRIVLFSGTPCQVGGLKTYLRKDYENLLTVDFVCHSVPSPMAWREYIKYRAGQDHGGEWPVSINLRSKETGWSKYQYSNLFTYRDSTHSAKSGESLYMKLFIGGYISRNSCASCQFKGYSRASDLTIGDFWGIWDISPDMDDNKGTSVVLVQSKRGEKLLKSASEQLVLKSVTLEESSRQNPAMLKTSQPNARRAEALLKMRSGNIDECESWFSSAKSSLLQRTYRKVRAIFHTQK